MVNKRFIKRKIGFIQGELFNLEKLSKFSFQEIVSDFIKQSALERILGRIVARAVDINEHLIFEFSATDATSPQSYKDTFLRLPER